MSASPPAATPLRPPAAPPDGLIFDLDGTLWDSCETVALAWNRVRLRLALTRPPFTAGELRGIMGKTHAEIRRALFPNLDEPTWERLALACYAEEERQIHERGGRLFPGVPAGVRALSARYRLFIVSNCQRGYIESFLAWSGLGHFFADHECHGNTGVSKAENLRALGARNGLRAPVYIGDTAGDRRAAEEAGLPFFLARYGFGQHGFGGASARGEGAGFEDFGRLTRYFLDMAEAPRSAVP